MLVIVKNNLNFPTQVMFLYRKKNPVKFDFSDSYPVELIEAHRGAETGYIENRLCQLKLHYLFLTFLFKINIGTLKRMLNYKKQFK